MEQVVRNQIRRQLEAEEAGRKANARVEHIGVFFDETDPSSEEELNDLREDKFSVGVYTAKAPASDRRVRRDRRKEITKPVSDN